MGVQKQWWCQAFVQVLILDGSFLKGVNVNNILYIYLFIKTFLRYILLLNSLWCRG